MVIQGKDDYKEEPGTDRCLMFLVSCGLDQSSLMVAAEGCAGISSFSSPLYLLWSPEGQHHKMMDMLGPQGLYTDAISVSLLSKREKTLWSLSPLMVLAFRGIMLWIMPQDLSLKNKLFGTPGKCETYAGVYKMLHIKEILLLTLNAPYFSPTGHKTPEAYSE